MAFLTKLKDELEIQLQKSDALLKITNSINQNYKIKDLLAQYEDVMKNDVGVGKLVLVNHLSNWSCILHYGTGCGCKEKDYSILQKFRKIACVEDLDLEGFSDFDILVPVFHKDKPLSYLLIGDLDVKDVHKFKIKHKDFIKTITNIISVSIETKTLANKLLEKKLEERDMELAAEMQRMLFPDKLPHTHKVDVSATYIPKQMVSGDYYDFIQFSETEYVFCIADVSGKGVSAALLMSNLQANVRANIKYNANNLTLEELVMELNESVLNNAKGEKFITFFIGYFNEETRKLKYINAGHNYPILKDKNGIKELKIGCTVLGIFENFPSLESETIIIEPNTIIVCYTDGITEVENEDKEQYESDRLSEAISANSYMNMGEMNKAILKEIDEFKGENDFPDDTAILSIRII